MKTLTNSAVIIILFLSLAITTKVYGQTNITSLSPAEMVTDFRIYRTTLEEAHAGLYLYITPEELEDEFKVIEREIVKPMDKNEFYKLLLKTTSKLKHGHCFLVNDQPYGINYKLRDLVPTQQYLPFTLKIIENKVFIAVDCSSKKAAKSGAQLLQINGVPVDSLLVQFQKYIPADGGNLSYKNFKLENFLFHYLYSLLNPKVNRYKIVSRSITGKVSEFVLDGIKPLEMEDNYKFHTGKSVNYYPKVLDYQVIDTIKAISYLKVTSFYEGLTNRNGVEFSRFIDSAFHKISEKKTKKLIIDLRDNEGGNDRLAILLFSYLTNSPFKQCNPTYIKSDSISILSYARDPDEDLVQFAAHPSVFVNKIQGKFILKQEYDEPSYATYNPTLPTYSGKLIIVTNGGSFSATSRFINTAAYYMLNKKQLVRFVGENYGGDDSIGYATGGGSLNVILPNSHFRFTVPVKEYSRFIIRNKQKGPLLSKKMLQEHRRILEDVQLEKVIEYTRNL